MAFINCPNCNEKVSDKVAICPNCNALLNTNSAMQKPTKMMLKVGLGFLVAAIASLSFGFWAFSSGGIIFVILGIIGFGVAYFAFKDYKNDLYKYHLSQTDRDAYDKYVIEEREKRIEEQRLLNQQRAEKEAKKYNHYRYKCPMCQSNKIMNISTTKKVVSTEVFGLASNKIGKTYQCDDCKYMW